MTIATSGPLRFTALKTEYGGTGPLRLSQYYRGHASMFVRANSADNIAVNNSANVPLSGLPLRMSKFYGQAKGWTYTNTTVRTNNYYPHTVFGADHTGANGANWPLHFINNATMNSSSTSYWAVLVAGRKNVGPITFTNNAEIQGAGGAPNSGAGMHAMHIYNSEGASYANRVIIINNYAIRGGGGAGGIGGTGGTGGQGYYDTAYTAQEGPAYSVDYQEWTHNTYLGAVKLYWGGYIGSAPTGSTAHAIGGYTYYRHTYRQATFYPPNHQLQHYEIYRQWPSSYQTVTGGGAGGGGGNGGYGQGSNWNATGGAAGAGGAAGGVNAGAGGQGGTGGTGGTWGAVGNTGNTGAGGGYGNYSGWGPGGAAGAAGGAAGYSIYAAASCPWGLANYNTIQGPYGGGTAPS